MSASITPLWEKHDWKAIHTQLKQNKSTGEVFDIPTSRYCLHFATKYKAPEYIIEALLKISQMGLERLDGENCAPIHYAIRHKYPLAILESLLGTNPEKVLSLLDTEGRSPLQLAIMERADASTLLLFIKTAPNVVKARLQIGTQAIHLACQYQSSVEVVSALLEVDEVGLSNPVYGRLPLHLACEHKSSFPVVDLLLQKYPAAAEYRGHEGKLPIHFAVAHKQSLMAISRLMETNPAGLMHKDRSNRLPLHWALESNAHEDAVVLMISKAPVAATKRGFGSPGNFPINIAVDKHWSIRTIAELLRAYPDGAKEADLYGYFPLRVAVRNKADMHVISALVSAFPDGAKEVDEYGRLALHYCASRNMPYELLEKLVNAFPDGAKHADKNGQLPLHLAVLRLCPPKSISMIIKAYPKAAITPDKYSMVPLNYAVEDVNSSVELISALLAPEATRRASAAHACTLKGGKVALHFAVEFKRNPRIFELLLDAYVEGAAVRESTGGRLPIQWAMERSLPLETLRQLEKAYSADTAFVQDKFGMLPIHYAIENNAPSEIARLLLNVNPNIAAAKNHEIHQLLAETHPRFKNAFTVTRSHEPIDEIEGIPTTDALPKEFRDFASLYATEKAAKDPEPVRLLLYFAVNSGTSAPIVAEILEKTMPYSPKTGAINLHHFFSWTYILADTGDAYFEAVDMVLDKYEWSSELLHKLSIFPDEFNRRAIDIATPRCARALIRRMFYHSRFEILKAPVVHKSKYSLSKFGVDHDVYKKKVVLKFMKSLDQYSREVCARENCELSDTYVMPLVAKYNADESRIYREEAEFKGFGQYKYLIVVIAGDRSLQQAILHEYFAGRDEEKVRVYGNMILKTLEHIHSLGLIHGDLKPSNIVFHRDLLKLVDLGASARFKYAELIGISKINFSYTAPELASLYLQRLEKGSSGSGSGSGSEGAHNVSNLDSVNNNNNTIKSHNNDKDDDSYKVPVVDPSTSASDIQNVQYANDLKTLEEDTSCVSDPSMDMWSFGAVLFYMCVGEQLFLSNFEDGLNDNQMELLAQWPQFAKQQRLLSVPNPIARNLISQLLNYEPTLRPTVQYASTHPFLTGQKPDIRFPGEIPLCDVYIAYRRSAPASEEDAAFPASGSPTSPIRTLKTPEGPKTPNGSLRPLIEDEIHCQLLKQSFLDAGKSVLTSSDTAAAAHEGREDSSDLLDHDQEKEYYRIFKNMCKSRAAVIVISRFALNSDPHSFSRLKSDSPIDQFYFEMKLALELSAMGYLENGIYVVAVGDQVPAPPVSPPSSSSPSRVGGARAGGRSSSNTPSRPRTGELSNNGGGVSGGGGMGSSSDVYSPKAGSSSSAMYQHRIASPGPSSMRGGVQLAPLAANLSLSENQSPVNRGSSRGRPRTGSRGASGGNGGGLDETIIESTNYNQLEEEVYYGCYFDFHLGDIVGKFGGSHPHTCPKCIVTNVERKISELFMPCGLGLPLVGGMNVQDVVNRVVNMPIVYIMGARSTTFANAYRALSNAMFAPMGGGLIGAADNGLMQASGMTATGRPTTSGGGFVSPSRPTSTGGRLLQSSIAMNLNVSMPSFSGSSPQKYQRQQIKASSGTLLDGSKSYAVSPAFSYSAYSSSAAGGGITLGVIPGAPDNNNNNNNNTNTNRSRPGSEGGTGVPGVAGSWAGFWAPRVSSPDGKSFAYDSTAGIVARGKPTSPGYGGGRAVENDVAFYDQSAPQQQLPFFTEIVAEDKAKSSILVSFMSEKLRSREAEIMALHEEMRMMRQHLDRNTDDLVAVRAQIKVTSLL